MTKRDRDLIIVPTSTLSDTASPMLQSVIVRAPSGGTPSTSVSFIKNIFNNLRFKNIWKAYYLDCIN